MNTGKLDASYREKVWAEFTDCLGSNLAHVCPEGAGEMLDNGDSLLEQNVHSDLCYLNVTSPARRQV